MSRSEKPGNWPSQVTYITRNIYSKKIDAAVLNEILPKSAGAGTSGGVSKLVKIKLITDKAHPACGQYGLFSARKLTSKCHVLDYMGFVHSDLESDPTSDYDISLDSGLGIAIDAQRWGNEGRMVNDYRGIASKPNVMFDDHWVDGEKRIGIYVMPGRDIAKGEELLVSYGKGMYALNSPLFHSTNGF